MVNIHDLAETYTKEFALYGRPIEVNFREMFPALNKADRYTHQIHSYPAKLLCHIPYFFLQTEDFCPKEGTVLDPFCGTGTVALETALTGRTAYGADANPLARQIARVKLRYIPRKRLERVLEKVLSDSRKITDVVIADDTLKMWYSETVLMDLIRIHRAVSCISTLEIREFFEVCLSATIKKVSLADPRIAVPVRLNPERFRNSETNYEAVKRQLEEARTADVFARFTQVAKTNMDRLQTLDNVSGESLIISEDARKITIKCGSRKPLPSESVDMVLTSPPYAGAQKYIRASRLNLYWLGVQSAEGVRQLNAQNIGREDYHKDQIIRVTTGIPDADEILHRLYDNGKRERSYIVGNYLLEMLQALDESIRVLKPGGTMVIVIGNNTVCGEEFDTQAYLTYHILQKGLKLQFKLIDDIKSYGLMTKRNKTASRISREWILVFKK